MTSDLPVATTTVDRLLAAFESGRGGDVAGLYTGDAVLDATVPGWRFARRGATAIADQYAKWFTAPGRLEELVRLATPSGEVVAYLLAWEEGGVPHAARHCHILDIDAGSGHIRGEQVFCGGQWDAALLARMEEEAAEVAAADAALAAGDAG